MILIDQIIEREIVLNKLCPLFDRMIGVHALNVACDMDKDGGVPYYDYMRAILVQIIYNHSIVDNQTVTEVLRDKCNGLKEIRSRLHITDDYITEDDLWLINKNRDIVDSVTIAIKTIHELTREINMDEWELLQ